MNISESQDRVVEQRLNSKCVISKIKTTRVNKGPLKIDRYLSQLQRSFPLQKQTAQLFHA